ncbi:hypothetical protein ACLOJK_036174 [Asimina triloba]
MASLPSVAVTSTLKLEPEIRKFSSNSHQNFSVQILGLQIPARIRQNFSNPSISYQRSSAAAPSERNSDLLSLDFREALSILKETNKVERALYIPLLQECIDRKSLPGAQILHTHVIKTGAYQDLFLSTFLSTVYAKCGAMEFAQKLFDGLPRRNVVTWTALISGYIKNSQPEIAIQIFEELLECGMYPSNYTLGAVLSACSSLYSLELGKQIHGYIIKYQLESDTSVGNSLCTFYSKFNNLESVVKAFRRISEKNVISWTVVISACIDYSNDMGLKLFMEMLSGDTEPNEFTMTSVLSLCCEIRALEFGQQVHALCLKLGYESNLKVKNSIMYLYLKSGWIDEARRLFDGMETVTLVTWNAMIAGHAQMIENAKDESSAYNSGIEAFKIFLRLNRSSFRPDLFTFSSILTVCSSLVALEQGEQIHAQTIKTGFLSDVVLGSSLVNMYNKCGSIEKASRAFVEMPTRTMVSWTTMITGFSQHGWSKETLQLFEDMRLAGVGPNQITFVGVLAACSHAGMVDEALKYFNLMKKDYGIPPVMDHYTCLIAMYVRLGRLVEAFDFVNKMNFEPSEFIWSMLIAGARNQGNMELAFYAADRLLELKPKDAETYALLLDMYLLAGRWNYVSKVREMMKEEKVAKLNDWSWTSIKGRVYSFRPDDRSHSQSTEMYELLEGLVEKAKSLGYIKETRIEIANQEDKEKADCSSVHHSEKLAIAFGLLNMPDDAPGLALIGM